MADREFTVATQGVTVTVRLKDTGEALLTIANDLGRTYESRWELITNTARRYYRVGITDTATLKAVLDAVPAS